MASARQALTIGGLSVLTAGLTYCLYFDYKRRNDPVFRKELLKEQRRLIKKNQDQDRNASRQLERMLEAAVAAVNAEPLPTTVEGKEQFFMEQVGTGEMLASKMPRGAMPAAIAFFKAYKVYPSPQELMVIYQRTMPPEIFAIIVEMIKLDVNRVLNSARNSYRTPGYRPPSSSDGPVIEEITGDERELIEALKSVAASGPSSAAAKPTSPAAKPTADESKPISGESQSTSGESQPTAGESQPTVGESQPAAGESQPISGDGEPTGEEAASNPTPLSGNPSGYSLTQTSSLTPSENGSATGASQTANSFVLVDDDSTVQAHTSENIPTATDATATDATATDATATDATVTDATATDATATDATATESENPSSDNVDSHDQPREEASQEPEEEPINDHSEHTPTAPIEA